MSNLLTIIALLCTLFINCAQAATHYRTYNAKQGLPQVTVTAMAFDQSGFLWVGTQDGLARFDGYQFQVYSSADIEKHGLRNSYIHSLLVDSSNQLWVGTANGLFIYRDQIDRFESVTLDEQSSQSLQINHIVEDNNTNLWLATQRGLFRLDITTKSPRGIPNWFQKFAKSEVLQLLLDDQNILWVATRHRLFSLDSRRSKVNEIMLNGESIEALSLANDYQYRVWIGTKNQGLLFASANSPAIRLKSLSQATYNLKAMTISQNKQLWIGADNGLFKLQLNNLSLTRYGPDEVLAQHFPDGNIASLGIGPDQEVLVGTYTTGFVVMPPVTELFTNYVQTQANSNALMGRTVFSVAADSEYLWIGTNEGLNRVDRNNNQIKKWPRAEMGDSFVAAMCLANNDWLYLGRTNHHLQRFNTKSELFETIELASPVRITAIKCHQNKVYVVTRGAGLYIFDEKSESMQHISVQHSAPLHIPSDFLQSIHIEDNGMIWLGSSGYGLIQYNPEDGYYQQFAYQRGDEFSLSDDLVLGISQADENSLWVATKNGLNLFDKNDNQFDRYTTANGLPNNTIYAATKDNAGHLWLPTNNGLSRFNIEEQSFWTFDTESGINSNEFNAGAVATSDNSEHLYFGSIDGLIEVVPNEFALSLKDPRVTVTDLRLFNQHISPSTPKSPLTSPIYDATELTFDHDQNFISFDFSTLKLSNQTKVEYRYRLLGLNDTWLATNASERRASYTNLPAGQYQLQVMARYQHHQWGPVTQLEIRIKHAWYDSPAAKLFYLMIVALIIYFFYLQNKQKRQVEKQALDVIKQNEEQLQLALSASGDELWRWDLIKHKLTFDAPIKDVIHKERLDINDTEQLKTIIHAEDVASIQAAYQAHRSGKTDFYQCDYRCRGVDSEWVWLLSKGKITERAPDGSPKVMSGVSSDVTKLKAFEGELRVLNAELEVRVKERTKALEHSNIERQETIDKLINTQAQLVQSEKMASLGAMVAGISHEVNTPLGICVTSISHLIDSAEGLFSKYDQRTMSGADFEFFRADFNETLALTEKNIQRANGLIHSFKQVSVDQSAEQVRPFDLKQLLDNTITTLKPRFTKTAHQISLKCPKNINMNTFPGALSQVVINLVTNTLEHGFEDVKQGKIEIEALQDTNNELFMIYRDNGAGMEEEVVKRLFDPFFTTNRDNGNTGLGMHICFNIISQQLKGEILANSFIDSGAEFYIRVPIDIETLANKAEQVD